MSAITITVDEPEAGKVGAIYARAGECGPEVCWACGPEYGDWYLMVNEVAAHAAGMDGRQHIACHREEAEYMVRLIAGLYERTQNPVDD